MDISYREAVETFSLRQKFLDRVDLGSAKRYVRKVIYGSEEGGSVMTCKGTILMRPKVIVRPLAFSFEVHANSFDFHNSLIYHEGQHAREKVERIFGGMPTNISLYDIDYWVAFDILGELRAYRNQVKNFVPDNSERFVDFVQRKTKSLIKILTELGVEDWTEKYGGV